MNPIRLPSLSFAVSTALATLLAAAACDSTESTSQYPPPDASTPADSGQGPNTGDGGGGPTDGGGPSDASDASDSSDGSDSGDSGDGGGCVGGDTGTAFDCNTLTNGCAAQCSFYTSDFKVSVGKAIGECMAKAQTCDGNLDVGKQCANEVLARTCEDPTTTDFCTPLVTACQGASGGAFTLDACRSIAKGLNGTGRTIFVSCVTADEAGGCQPDPITCIDSYR